jgi:hypothetical protein
MVGEHALVCAPDAEELIELIGFKPPWVLATRGDLLGILYQPRR